MSTLVDEQTTWPIHVLRAINNQESPMEALINYTFFDGAGALTWPIMGAAVIGAICVGIWNFFKRPS